MQFFCVISAVALLLLLASSSALHRKHYFLLRHNNLHPKKDVRGLFGPAQAEAVVPHVPQVLCSRAKSDTEIGQSYFISKRGDEMGALALLIVQNAGLILAIRASRLNVPTEKLYNTKGAVVVSECLKLISSIAIYKLYEKGSLIELVRKSFLSKESLQVTVPSALYVVQNNLQFIAVSNLPAQVYHVLIQMKVITTALLSEIVLDRKHTRRQWGSLLSLFAGLAVVQLAITSATATSTIVGNVTIGLIAVLVSCLTSGFAGVYMEKIVKSEAPEASSLWGLNIKMSLCSVLIALFSYLAGQMKMPWNAHGARGTLTGAATATAAVVATVTTKTPLPFFHGYNPTVALSIFLQAFGGLVVAIVVKKTNSVVKGFATSGAVVLSCLVSRLLFNDFSMSPLFFLGTAIVTLSAIAYSLPADFSFQPAITSASNNKATLQTS